MVMSAIRVRTRDAIAVDFVVDENDTVFVLRALRAGKPIDIIDISGHIHFIPFEVINTVKIS